jgi:mRNA-degrading endonuclease YafQ of YafQ-DinJ toxin-antitoxin module
MSQSCPPEDGKQAPKAQKLEKLILVETKVPLESNRSQHFNSMDYLEVSATRDLTLVWTVAKMVLLLHRLGQLLLVG